MKVVTASRIAALAVGLAVAASHVHAADGAGRGRGDRGDRAAQQQEDNDSKKEGRRGRRGDGGQNGQQQQAAPQPQYQPRVQRDANRAPPALRQRSNDNDRVRRDRRNDDGARWADRSRNGRSDGARGDGRGRDWNNNGNNNNGSRWVDRNRDGRDDRTANNGRSGRDGRDWNNNGRNDRNGRDWNDNGRGRGDRWDNDRDRRGRDWNGRNGRRDYAGISQWRRNFHSPRRYRTSAYYAPRGYHYRRWSYGQYLPDIYWSRRYWLFDFIVYGLFEPPSDLVWVQYGPDALLIDRYTGEIIQVRYDVFYW